ncbi:IS5/IS1182 family transposase, partial [Streptococcus agalactiae]
IMAGIVFLVCLKVIISRPIVITIVKEKTSWINIPVCLQSDQKVNTFWFFIVAVCFQNRKNTKILSVLSGDFMKKV